ncbi:PH domain-containing protein [Streptomyces sp. URMC 123]|uniref:PH domain-containing protein n=1 Tax=Streptomyces sp. URMC 123 TaxID=3423403 RepID=UPI003F1C1D2A
MTSPEPSPTPKGAQRTPFADRVHRSPAALVGGVLLLALAGWLGGDALIRGDGRTRWLALAGLLLAVPLIVAYTLRPAVYAGQDRLRVRNPFRTITLPWGCVEGVRAGYSSEVLADGAKYQLWAIPVSLRQRKRAARQAARAAARPAGAAGAAGEPAPGRATFDQAVEELNELAERRSGNEGAQGSPSVRWAYEIIAPSAVGAILLAVLLATG